MPNFFLIFFLGTVVIVLLIIARKKVRGWFNLGLFLVGTILVLAGLWAAYLHHLYTFEISEKAGTIVVNRVGRNFGTFGPDLAPEVLAGSITSPWLQSLGTYGGDQYEWGQEHTPAEKMVWEGNEKCWIDRWGSEDSPRGMFVGKDGNGKWKLLYQRR